MGQVRLTSARRRPWDLRGPILKRHNTNEYRGIDGQMFVGMRLVVGTNLDTVLIPAGLVAFTTRSSHDSGAALEGCDG